jgi:hypothetical protein
LGGEIRVLRSEEIFSFLFPKKTRMNSSNGNDDGMAAWILPFYKKNMFLGEDCCT